MITVVDWQDSGVTVWTVLEKNIKNLENLPSTFLGDNNSADRNGQKDTCKSLMIRYRRPMNSRGGKNTDDEGRGVW